MRATLLFAGLLVGVAPARAADPPCGVVEIRFAPGAKDLQIVVWIEDSSGTVIATPYLTRTTGQFGLANRPGNGLLKTAFGWPYGRREMVAPVWAHRRNHHYPKVLMGGRCGNSPLAACPGHTCSAAQCSPQHLLDPESGDPQGCCCGDCNDDTIAYHALVSSGEPFYCPPDSLPDAVSCASKFTGAKGAYSTDGSFSLYPPRADLLNSFNPSVDSPDLLDFAAKNDLVAVSAATPPSGVSLSPPVDWFPGPLQPGDYVAWVEASQESDFNASHNHPNVADAEGQWNNEGHPFLGQPSVLWKIPFHYDGNGQSAIATSYAGYGDWDGATGTLHPPDGTITTTMNGSGAGRLSDVNQGGDVYRAKVVVGNCGGTLPDGGVTMPNSDGGAVSSCMPPNPVEGLTLTPDQTSVNIGFTSSASGPPANRFSIRYRPGDAPIGDAEFDLLPAAPSAVGDPGQPVNATLDHLNRDTAYTIGVRAVAPCGAPSAVVSRATRTAPPKFVTLHGCFIATAAYGSPLEAHVNRFRAFRDHQLYSNPAGRLLTALYYALSPPVAQVIGANQGLRALVRRALEPMVGLLR